MSLQKLCANQTSAQRYGVGTQKLGFEVSIAFCELLRSTFCVLVSAGHNIDLRVSFQKSRLHLQALDQPLFGGVYKGKADSNPKCNTRGFSE